MSDLDTAALRALDAAASPAPWAPVLGWEEGGVIGEADSRLIVAIRNALPALLAELEAVRAERDQLAAELAGNPIIAVHGGHRDDAEASLAALDDEDLEATARTYRALADLASHVLGRRRG
ncbi:MAG: hypothetical protein IRZ28_20840 [Steroidobacteraceae bacterium]|nr:hypothetical protein [Steroidobacteraceae bacterium]